MKRFVFLICSERSGSNFVTKLLNGHPSICGPAPSHLFRLFGTNMGRYPDLEDNGNWYDLVDDFVSNFQTKLGRWSTTLNAEELLNQAATRSSAELLRIAYEKEAAYHHASHILVKENHTYDFASFLMAYFPDCFFLFVTRDPRDVAASWVKTGAVSGGVERAVNVWLRDQSEAVKLYYQLEQSERIHFLRYEDLLSDPVGICRSICGFLGIPYDEGMQNFYKDPLTRRNAERIEAWANLSAPVLRNNFGKYKSVLSSDDVKFVELLCYDLMCDFGYQPDHFHMRPTEKDVEQMSAALFPVLTKGEARSSNPGEKDIRSKRLAAINAVLERSQKCLK